MTARSAPDPLIPTRRVRAFVWTFLAVFAICGARGYELWPLTAWRLFSHVRTEYVRGWQVTAVDAAGDEHVVPLDNLPVRYRGWQHVAGGLGGRPETERLEVCRSWAAVAGAEAIEGRIYATEESLREPGSFRRELRYSCDLRGGQ